MKWDCYARARRRDERITQRNLRLSEPHRWFAWYPVHIEGGCIWLETVERKGHFNANFPPRRWYGWTYEEIPNG